MVAEGPAVKMFDRLQQSMLADDLELLWRVVAHAVAAGRLPSEALTAVDIRGIAPTLAVRDQMQEAQRFQIEKSNGILSPQTWTQRLGLDYDQEQANIAAHAARTGQTQKPMEVDAGAMPMELSGGTLLGLV